MAAARFVWNGLDPDRYVEGASPRDYLLFVAALDWAHDKGLDIAVDIARRTSQRLLVAGTARTREMLDAVTGAFGAPHVEFLGDVRGPAKARLYAGARALVCPSRLNEGCPLAIIEALMSGTPVISSGEGACPDMVTPEVGVVCRTTDEYVRAIDAIDADPAGHLPPARDRALSLSTDDRRLPARVSSRRVSRGRPEWPHRRRTRASSSRAYGGRARSRLALARISSRRVLPQAWGVVRL